MNILGVDIGYSNLKLAAGVLGDSTRTHMRPAGAAPADRFGVRFDGRPDESGIRVLVDGQEFVAGVPADRAEMWTRALHAGYTSSASYKALFHAGLLLSEMEKIDVLVTGLPVSQHFDEVARNALVRQLQGVHQVTPKRAFVVDKVKVIPQPIGGLLDFIDQTDARLENARVLVVDPGFFSVDWVVVDRQRLSLKSSGTSLNASSVVLEEAARLIAKDHGAPVSTEILENAVRDGRTIVLVLGQGVEIAPYIELASQTVAPVVVDAIQKSLRGSNMLPDLVVLVGGGAEFFKPALQGAFPQISVETPREAALSNARGFWLMGNAL